MDSTRRRSRRNMSKEDLDHIKAAISKANKEKEKEQQKRLRSIDEVIKQLTPATSRKVKSSFKKLHTAHKAKQQLRTFKKREQQRRAKATRLLSKRIKKEKLDKENAKVLKVLMNEGNIPIDVAMIIAKDRQSLQNEDKRKKRARDKIESEITGLKSTIPGTESAIMKIQQEIDTQRHVQKHDPHRWDSEDEDGSRWMRWFERNRGQKLSNLRRRKKEIEKNISDLKVSLKALK